MRALLAIPLMLAGCAEAQVNDAPQTVQTAPVAEVEPAPIVMAEQSAPALEPTPVPEPAPVGFNAEMRYLSRTDHAFSQIVDGLNKTKPIPVELAGLDAANAHFGGEILLAPPQCHGDARQGGLVVCHLPPFSNYKVGKRKFTAGGPFGTTAFIGFDRDAAKVESFTYTPQLHGEKSPTPVTVSFKVAAQDYDISRIDGLPKNMVSEYTEDELVRIRRASARKKVGFASKVDDIGFIDGFILPIQGDYTKTTNFGAQRVLNGEPKSPHYGVDLAAPKGTPIVAPADGIVSLADDDMYFEGSLIMIDHGQGLISYYLHNEDVLVEDGQIVRQGEQIATVGSRGRSTGPHLCWRLKWHGRNLDPELLTKWNDG